MIIEGQGKIHPTYKKISKSQVSKMGFDSVRGQYFYCYCGLLTNAAKDSIGDYIFEVFLLKVPRLLSYHKARYAFKFK